MAWLHAVKAAKKHKTGKDAPPIVVSDAEEAALDAADAEEAPSASAAPGGDKREGLRSDGRVAASQMRRAASRSSGRLQGLCWRRLVHALRSDPSSHQLENHQETISFIR